MGIIDRFGLYQRISTKSRKAIYVSYVRQRLRTHQLAKDPDVSMISSGTILSAGCYSRTINWRLYYLPSICSVLGHSLSPLEAHTIYFYCSENTIFTAVCIYIYIWINSEVVSWKEIWRTQSLPATSSPSPTPKPGPLQLRQLRKPRRPG